MSLDRLPRIWRHLLIGLLYVTLSWAASDLLPAISPWLSAHPPLGPLAGALLAQLLLVVTPLVRYSDSSQEQAVRTVVDEHRYPPAL